MATGTFSAFPINWRDDVLSAIGAFSAATGGQVNGPVTAVGAFPAWSVAASRFSAGLASGLPSWQMVNAAAAVDAKAWDAYAGAGFLAHRMLNDAGTAAQTWVQVNRSAMAVTTIEFPQGAFGFGTSPTLATLQVSGNLRSTSPGGGTGTSFVGVGGSSNFQVTHTAASTRVKVINSASAGADMSFGSSTTENLVVESTGAVTFSHPIKHAQYTLSTLPSASAFNGYIIDVSNATGGPRVCRSNGTSWLRIDNNAAVS